MLPVFDALEALALLLVEGTISLLALHTAIKGLFAPTVHCQLTRVLAVKALCEYLSSCSCLSISGLAEDGVGRLPGLELLGFGVGGCWRLDEELRFGGGNLDQEACPPVAAEADLLYRAFVERL